jgi:hypothetical protein
MIDKSHEKEIERLLDDMKLVEKISRLSGRNTRTTMSIDRLGIPSIVMTEHAAGTGRHLVLPEKVCE